MAAIYPLAPLLSVRETREQRAAAEVVRTRNALAEAREHRQSCQEKLEEYHQWRLAEEERRWTKFLARRTPLKKVEEFRTELAQLGQEELMYETQLDEAVKKVDEAEANLRQAQEEHNETVRKLEKLNEHRQQWRKEVELEEERKLNLEFEDFHQRQNELLANDSLDPDLEAYESCL